MDLFEGSPLEMFKNAKIEWSYSRRQVLEHCPRRYYYQYYGANNRTAKVEPQKGLLRFLKTLTNRHMRIGNILHLVIGTYLKKCQQGEMWSCDKLLSWAQNIYHRDREYSRTRAYKHAPSQERYPPLPLLEFHFQFEGAEELYAESEQRLLEALRNFTTSLTFSSFRTGGSLPEAVVEKQIRLKKQHFSARGQADLVYPNGPKIVIVDWKIGGLNEAAKSLQLLFYALWAVKKYRCLPEDVNIYKAYLIDNKVSPFAVSERNLQRASARIIQDVEKMKALDGYGKNAIAEAFTPCGQSQICVLCPFQGMCPKE